MPDQAEESAQGRVDENDRSPLRRFSGVLLGVYWLSLFVVTHASVGASSVSIPGADKFVHFTLYGVLGLLLSLRVGFSRKLTWRTSAILLLIIAVYGVFDELLQIPVGRTCDVYDWLFDVAGASTGITAMKLFGNRRS